MGINLSGEVGPSGAVSLRVIRGGQLQEKPEPDWPFRAAGLPEIAQFALPQKGLPAEVNEWRTRNQRHLWRSWKVLVNRHVLKSPVLYGAVWLDLWHGDERVPLGLASLRLVTDTGVAYIVDALQNLTEMENLKFHGFGIGTTAEAQTQTALVTELTTEYATDNVRPTGSQTEAAANIYRSVATLSPDGSGTLAITEHALFSQAATAGGVMYDRSVFAAVNLNRGVDSLQITYDGTFTAGG